MAKKGGREKIKLKSSESPTVYWTIKNKRNTRMTSGMTDNVPIFFLDTYFRHSILQFNDMEAL